MISSREAAAFTLYDVLYKGAYSNLALKERMAKNKGMSAEERSFLTNLVYGTVSRHYTLLYIIGKYAKRKKIDRSALIALELGLYQILYMDKVPESAAVDESVKLAKKRNPQAGGFVNAVLRAFIRDGKRIDYPEDETEYLSVKYSYSPDTVRLFKQNFADRAESIMAALNEPPRLMLRINPIKTTVAETAALLGVASEPAGGALLAVDGFDIAGDELYKKGFYSVQDAAAYNAAIALDPQPGEVIIDMCAAPGGKATHIAELTGDRARVIACDVHEHKIRLIENAARRLGLSSIKTRLSDGTVTDNSLISAAERVLCDVPCSGLGIIRRKPDIKLGRTDISALPALQLSILSNGAKYVKPGGVIVYSTCTINKVENEGVTSEFLKNGGFVKLYEKTYLPDEDGTDGFYICKMGKT